MIGYACEVAATTARARVPELIAEALAPTRAAAAAAPRPRRTTATTAGADPTGRPSQEVAT